MYVRRRTRALRLARDRVARYAERSPAADSACEKKKKTKDDYCNIAATRDGCQLTSPRRRWVLKGPHFGTILVLQDNGGLQWGEEDLLDLDVTRAVVTNRTTSDAYAAELVARTRRA